jgi:hypothetical protein
MTTLKEAWSWYETTIRALQVTHRLGDLYWDGLPWDGRLGKEARFKEVKGPWLAEAAEQGMNQLDDLAIVLFFSIFESIVRERIRGEVDVERQTLRHPVLKSASEKTDQELDRGSFHRVLELLKTYDSMSSNRCAKCGDIATGSRTAGEAVVPCSSIPRPLTTV